MEKRPILFYSVPLPEEINRPPILPVEPVRRINVRSPEQERELMARFRSLPPELRNEVLRFHNDRNRQLFRLLFNYITNVIIDTDRLEDIPNSREVRRVRASFQPLFDRYHLKTRINIDGTPAYPGTWDVFFDLDDNINNDIIPNEAIRDLLYLIIDLRFIYHYIDPGNRDEYIGNINGSLRQYSNPYRIVRYKEQFNVEKLNYV